MKLKFFHRSPLLFCVAHMIATTVIACSDEDPYGGVTFEGEFGQPLPFDLHAGLVFIEASIDGGEARPYIVDSGAQYVLLQSSVAQELGYTSRVNDVDELRLGELRFFGVDAIPYDLTSIEQTLDVEIDGILGASLFQYFTTVVDYQEQVFTMFDEGDETSLIEAAHVGEARAVELDLRYGLPMTTASFESSEPAHMIIDTGASTVALFESFYEALGNDGRNTLQGSDGLSAAGTFPVDMTRFCGVALGEAIVPDVTVSVLADDSLGDIKTAFPELVGLVGYTFLREFLTVFDYPERSARFYRYVDRRHIPMDEFIQAGLVLNKASGGSVDVATVYPGTDAEAQGLEEGDVVLTINGDLAENLSLEELAGALTGDVSDTVVLEVERDGEAQRFEILIEDLLPACDG